MPAVPYRRLAGFYFFYFAYLGAFAPFFSLYLKSVGISAVEIGMLMALPQLSRIVAPHVWGWLADRSASRLAIVRLAALRERPAISACLRAADSLCCSRCCWR